MPKLYLLCLAIVIAPGVATADRQPADDSDAIRATALD
jgi:hypothetical protein